KRFARRPRPPSAGSPACRYARAARCITTSPAVTAPARSICAPRRPAPASSPAVRCARCSRRSACRTWWRNRSARRTRTTWCAPRSTRSSARIRRARSPRAATSRSRRCRRAAATSMPPNRRPIEVLFGAGDEQRQAIRQDRQSAADRHPAAPASPPARDADRVAAQQDRPRRRTRRFAGDPRHDRQGGASGRSGGEVAIMKLHELSDRPGASKTRKRIGRGIGSGKGKTGGRGGKGQTARSGVRIKGFEGGQMPLHRRLPKRGFKNTKFARKLNELNLGKLQAAIDAGSVDAAAKIDAAALVKAGVLRRAKDGVRLLGGGEIKAKVTLAVFGASKSAVAAVEKAGGSVEILAPKAEAGEQAA